MNLIMKKNVFRRGMAFALSTAVAVSIVPPLGTGSTARAAVSYTHLDVYKRQG